MMYEDNQVIIKRVKNGYSLQVSDSKELTDSQEDNDGTHVFPTLSTTVAFIVALYRECDDSDTI